MTEKKRTKVNAVELPEWLGAEIKATLLKTHKRCSSEETGLFISGVPLHEFTMRHLQRTTVQIKLHIARRYIQ